MSAVLRPLRTLARLGRCEHGGSSMLELAMVTPMLMIMVLGITDGANGFTAKLKLQQAAARTIELATAGGISSGAFNNLANEASSASGQSSSNVTVTKWLECDGTRQDSFDGTCTGSQQVARYVSVSITGTYTPMLAGVMAKFGLPSTIPVRGSASVRVQ